MCVIEIKTRISKRGHEKFVQPERPRRRQGLLMMMMMMEASGRLCQREGCQGK